MDTDDSLKSRILAEMTVNHADSLEKNFDLVKQFVQITTTGKIHIIDKEKCTSKEQIALYLIGKLYAKKAELTKEEYVDRSELVAELGLPTGTVDPKLKELVDTRIIEKSKDTSTTKYAISVGRIERILKDIQQKAAVINMLEEIEKIKEKLAAHEERIALLEASIINKPENRKMRKEQSLAEFLLEKTPTGDVQKALAIGFYLEHNENGPFTVKDLEEGFRRAKEKLPKNLSETINKNVTKGHMMEAKEKKGNLRTLVLTSTGERVVENKFGKQ